MCNWETPLETKMTNVTWIWPRLHCLPLHQARTPWARYANHCATAQQDIKMKICQPVLQPIMGVSRINRILSGACRFISVHNTPHHSVSASDSQLNPQECSASSLKVEQPGHTPHEKKSQLTKYPAGSCCLASMLRYLYKAPKHKLFQRTLDFGISF